MVVNSTEIRGILKRDGTSQDFALGKMDCDGNGIRGSNEGNTVGRFVSGEFELALGK